VQTLVGAACRLLNIQNDLSRTLNLSQFGQFDLLPSAEFEPIRHTLHCSPCFQSSRWRSTAGISIVTAMPDNNYTQVIQWSINYMTFAIMTEFVCPNYIKWNINRKDQKYFQDIYLKVQKKKKAELANCAHMYRSARLKDICNCELSNYIFINSKKIIFSSMSTSSRAQPIFRPKTWLDL
jgi:hypothetical protein